MPIIEKYRDMGTFVMGKVEAGEAKKGQTLLLMPNRVSVDLKYTSKTATLYFIRETQIFQTTVVIDQFYCDLLEVNAVGPGENVKAKLKGIEEEDVSPGFVLCDVNNPVSVGKIFDAQVNLMLYFLLINTNSYTLQDLGKVYRPNYLI